MSVIKSMKEVAKALQREHESTTFEILSVPVTGGVWKLKEKKNLAQLFRIQQKINSLYKEHRGAILTKLTHFGAVDARGLKPYQLNRFEAFLKTLENETTA